MAGRPPKTRDPKRKLPWLAYLWPGLPHLWVEGSWAGLALAIGFTVLFNLAVLNLVIWPELLQPQAKWVGGAALAGLWLAALVETRGELKRQAERRKAEAENRADPLEARQAEIEQQNDRQLAAAQRLYLAGDWVGTERILLPLTKTNKQDIEAHLLLATVWRRQGREKEAARRLQWLTRLEAAARWRFEIESELRITLERNNAIDPPLPEQDQSAHEPPETTHEPISHHQEKELPEGPARRAA